VALLSDEARGVFGGSACSDLYPATAEAHAYMLKNRDLAPSPCVPSEIRGVRIRHVGHRRGLRNTLETVGIVADAAGALGHRDDGDRWFDDKLSRDRGWAGDPEGGKRCPPAAGQNDQTQIEVEGEAP